MAENVTLVERFIKANCSSCQVTSNNDILKCEQVCFIALDVVWGVVHLLLGIVGIWLNTLSLYIFVKMGFDKPYNIVIIFQTLTDLVVSIVALYSALFLISGRDSVFDTYDPLCTIAGVLWNWNMVATPLLLSIAGLLRLKAVYMPHNNFFSHNKHIVIALCLGTYIYGIIFAIFPFFFKDFGYVFSNEWSICDFIYDAEKQQDIANVYSILMGPLPMFLSLVTIIATNILIALYLIGRYKSTWTAVHSNTEESSQGGGDPAPPAVKVGSKKYSFEGNVHSKHVILSLLFMTVWYILCYSLIIYNNFKNLLSAWQKEEVIEDGLVALSRLGTTYFYAAYNFSAYLNSFVNPFIHVYAGNNFRKQLVRLQTRIRRRMFHRRYNDTTTENPSSWRQHLQMKRLSNRPPTTDQSG